MAGALPSERLERVMAWGGADCVMAYVYRPTTVEGAVRSFAAARASGRTVGLRGAGQSYGDASLNAENVCLDLTRMDRVLAWDPDAGRIRAEPGVTIRRLWQHTIEDGWWPPVVPGTMAVSLGGGVAMNFHGKNNWKMGPIGDHVVALDVLMPSGDVVRCSRETEAELFHAVVGGFGMLGCIVGVDLQMKRVHSGLLDVEAVPTTALREMIGVFEARRDDADYLVGWVDCFARGDHAGRGLVHVARHLAPGEDPAPAQTLRPVHQELPDTLLGVVPKSIMWGVMRPFVNDPGVRLVNAAKYHQSRLAGVHRYRQSHVGFAFLLDYVPGWRRAYGPGGLIQFQSFIPAAQARATFPALLECARTHGCTPYLGVFKRHRPDDFLMTHAVDGYSMAMDFKVTTRGRRRLWRAAEAMAEIVVEAGGRFYPAKDSTLTPAPYAASLGPERLERFRAHKTRWDPDGLLQTNLSRRLLGTP
jgi:FAD/FMN-containing dehydrogenase